MLRENEELLAYYEANYPLCMAPPGKSSLDRFNSDGTDKKKTKELKHIANIDPRDAKFRKFLRDPMLVNPADAERNIYPLYSFKRCPDTEEGSRACRRLRKRERFIPGVLYGADPVTGAPSGHDGRIFIKTPWPPLQGELTLHTHHFSSRVYDLTLYEDVDDYEGVCHRVKPQNVTEHYHPVRLYNAPYCVNFVRYHPLRPISIPLRYINEDESPAMRRDGFIAPVQRYLEVIVEDGAQIPLWIDVDCSGLERHDVVRLKHLIIPEGCTISTRVRQDIYLVGTVFGRRPKEEELEAEAAAKAVEAEAKAPGTPAAASAS